MFSLAFLQHSFLKASIKSSQCKKLLWWNHGTTSSNSISSQSLTSGLQSIKIPSNSNPLSATVS
jgi:hypothetical protein